MKMFPIAFALGLAMASTLVLAAGHGEPSAQGAKAMPGMGMGMDHGMMGMDKMTPEQHQKKMDEMFAQMDANSDGSVTKPEFEAHHKAMMAKHRAMMDNMHKHTHAPATAPEAKADAAHKH